MQFFLEEGASTWLGFPSFAVATVVLSTASLRRSAGKHNASGWATEPVGSACFCLSYIQGPSQPLLLVPEKWMNPFPLPYLKHIPYLLATVNDGQRTCHLQHDRTDPVLTRKCRDWVWSWLTSLLSMDHLLRLWRTRHRGDFPQTPHHRETEAKAEHSENCRSCAGHCAELQASSASFYWHSVPVANQDSQALGKHSQKGSEYLPMLSSPNATPENYMCGSSRKIKIIKD